MENKEVSINPISVKQFDITIAGDGDLILNKMNDVAKRAMLDKQSGKAKKTEAPNEWEAIITSMHWYNGTPTNFSKEGLEEALKTNAPCISAFGLKKSFGDAVIRNEIDKYRTKFDAGVNIVAHNNLVPITFEEHFQDEKLIAAKKGSPVRSIQHRFTGWMATFTIQYMDTVWSDEQIVNIINLAGFGLGIGSGRSSGYGRYHVVTKSEEK